LKKTSESRCSIALLSKLGYWVIIADCNVNFSQGNRIMSLTLTGENVETVLDEMRPYLMADGGNVELVEIDGPTVKLRLQGACGSCPSSTMTLRMGIERRLREQIPEIAEVEQVL
jgi:Fe-S cluster biogenesis protein NfuA